MLNRTHCRRPTAVSPGYRRLPGEAIPGPSASVKSGSSSAALARQVRRLATAVERDLLHPLPIDQPGGLLPRTDELAEDHSPNADGDPPGHGAADPPGRGDGFRHAHGGGPPPPRPESHSTDARRGWRSKRSIASTRRLGVLKCGYYRPGIRGRLPTHY